MSETSITRRMALTPGSMAGLADTAAGGVATASPVPDLTSKAGRLRTFMRMRGAIDDGIVISFIVGRYYGVVDNALKPLYGVNSAIFTRYRQSSGLMYEGVECEQAYYTDLETGAVLDGWRNPYTNDVVKVPEYRSEPKPFKVDENLVFSSPLTGPYVNFEQSVAPPVILGNDIWFVEKTSAGGLLPGTTEPIHYAQTKTLHARVKELTSDGAKNRVRCNTHFTSVVNWRQWQKMGDRPGHLLGNGDGCYGASISDMSPVWREATLRLRPELIHDPIAVLEPGWKRSADK